MKQTIAMVLILIAAALGFVHGAKTFKDEHDAAAPPAPPAPVKRPPPERAEAPAPKKAPEPDLTEKDIADARAKLTEGDEAVKRGDYKAARAAYAEVSRRLGSLTSVVAIPLARLAHRGEAKAEVLGALAATIQPNEFSSGEQLTKITLKGEGGKPGLEQVVKVLDVKAASIVFRMRSGAEMELPRTELAKPVEPCSRDEWQRRVLKGFDDRKEKTDPENAFELFRLAAYGLENGIREQGIPYLERALAKDKLGLLPQYFCEPRDRPSPTAVQLARGGTEAEVAQAAGARPKPAGAPADAAEPAPAPAAEAPIGPNDVRASPKWKAAIARLDEGIEHYKKSFRGNAQAEQELKAALDIFTDVGNQLTALQDEFPNSATLEQKLVEVNQARVDCRKRAAVGG
jgi:hypothetical protein